MKNGATIRSYLRFDRSACLEIFDKNCPQFFSDADRADLELWLDGQDAGTITYDTSMADFFYVILKDFNVIGCGGFYIMKENPVARITWGMIHPDFHNIVFRSVKNLSLKRSESLNMLTNLACIVTTWFDKPKNYKLSFIGSLLSITLNHKNGNRLKIIMPG
ncbi:MAG: hypothetical protein ACI9JN_001409 [Bacteroidia bacterium]|jgi:hypothetical protein